MTLPIRVGTDDDRGLVVDSWRESYFDAPEVRCMGRNDYFKAITPRIERILDGGALVICAHDPLDETAVAGWACFDGPRLHYVFVRSSFRGQGIARALVTTPEPRITEYSHRSKHAHRTHGLRFTPIGLEFP